MATRWPNLFIVGVARAGTTSLAYCLDQHPDVFMAPVKEPYFFTRYHPVWVRVAHTESAYLELFEHSGDAAYRGEATPAYFWDKASAGLIKGASPDARIVISLREPVARAYSEFLLLRRSCDEHRSSFFSVVSEEAQFTEDQRGDEPQHNYVARGLYAEGVERFFDTFGRDRVHVLLFEEFVASPRSELEKIFGFLQLDPGFAGRIDFSVQNQGGVARNKLIGTALYSPRARRIARRMVPSTARTAVEWALMRPPKPSTETAEAAQMLSGVYAPDRKRLESILGRPVPWNRAEAGPSS